MLRAADESGASAVVWTFWNHAHGLLNECRTICHQKIFEGLRDRWQSFVFPVYNIPVEHQWQALNIERDKTAEL